MLKPLLLLSAVFLFQSTPTPAAAPVPQEAAPVTATAPAPTPAPPAPAVSNVKNPVKATTESQARAKKMYGFDCTMCHGDSGDGKTDLANDMKLSLVDLTDPATLTGKSDSELFDLIKNGKGKMPAEGDRAKTDEVWNLVLYVRNLPRTHTATAAKAGQ